jgi:hypothetical protein
MRPLPAEYTQLVLMCLLSHAPDAALYPDRTNPVSEVNPQHFFWTGEPL